MMIMETVKTVLRLRNLLLTPNLSWGIIKHSPNDPTVSTVSSCRIIPFFSGLIIKKNLMINVNSDIKKI